jgi:hypothetical protein
LEKPRFSCDSFAGSEGGAAAPLDLGPSSANASHVSFSGNHAALHIMIASWHGRRRGVTGAIPIATEVRVSFADGFGQNAVMSQDSPRPSFFKVITTPPLAYLSYAIAVLLVGGVAFYIGTLKPKLAPGVVPQSTSQPKN